MKRWTIVASFLSLFYVLTASAGVECLSGDAARNAFVTEKDEPYFSLLQPREMAAKTGVPVLAGTLQSQRANTRATYMGAVLECTADDIKGLESYIAIIHSSLKPVYPGLLTLPWRFVKVTDDIEGGLPHTRANVIVFSESLLKSIGQTAQKQQWQLSLMNILVHEQVHVIQRVNRKAFADLYVQQWGFRKVVAIPGAEAWLANHQIVNPDGVDVLWVWPVPGTSRVIWPRVILAGENPMPSMPEDFMMVGVELAESASTYRVVMDKKDVPRFHNLFDEPAFMEKFAGINSLYHPNEIAADYLAGLVLWDCMMDKNRVPAQQFAAMEKKFGPIRLWAQSTFKP